MRKAKGTFFMRMVIWILAALFGLLIFWSIGFLLSDIHVFRSPNRTEFFDARSDPSLKERKEALEMQLQELKHEHELIGQQRGFIKDSSSSLKIIVDNLFRLKSSSQGLISKTQFEQVLSSLDKIIAIQGEFKTTADSYLDVTNRKFSVQKQVAALKRQMDDERKTINNAYSEVMRRQRMRTALLKMVFLIPLVVVCTIWVVKRRRSIYRMIYVSTTLAVCLKTAELMHEHFPSRYFKYVFIGCMLGVVGWGFVWLIRRLAKPQIDLLLKQYRQAYERFLCPVCEYPIRTGPRKFLYWTRRTVHKTALGALQGPLSESEEAYTCPACGSSVFEPCAACGKISHSLLPHCLHCGAERSLSDA